MQSPILKRFRVDYSPRNGTSFNVTVGVNKSHVHLLDLEANENYTIHVAGVTTCGISRVSDPVHVANNGEGEARGQEQRAID